MVNWWLVTVAFVLGLVLTFAFTIRRAKREVPVYAGGGSSAAAATLVAAPAATSAPVTDDTAELPPGPHGPGTAAPNADGSGPTGWDVKGNEDSMLYHTTESPYYARTVAEVWFRDVESAEAAGFNRWDSGKSQRGNRK